MDSDDKQVRKVKKVKVDKTREQRAAIKPSNLGSSHPAVPRPTATSTSPQAQSAPASSGTVVTLEQFILSYLQSLPVGTLKQSVYGSKLSQKANAARKNFRIPASEDIYLILDTNIFGTCRSGLALCGQGIYFVDDRGQTGAIGWNSLKSYQLAASGQTLGIGSYRFSSLDSVTIGKMLAEIQSRLA